MLLNMANARANIEEHFGFYLHSSPEPIVSLIKTLYIHIKSCIYNVRKCASIVWNSRCPSFVDREGSNGNT